MRNIPAAIIGTLLVALILSPTVGGYLARTVLVLPYSLITGEVVNVDIWDGQFIDCPSCSRS